MNKVIINVKMSDDARIPVGKFDPSGEPVGVIQILHGFGEHIGLYNEVAKFFTDHGYALVLQEIRGFGRLSQSLPRTKKGYSPGYEYYMTDAATVREYIKKWYPDKKVILYGYSLGANVAMNLQLKYPEVAYEKIVLESPWLRLIKPLSPFTRAYLKVRTSRQPDSTLSVKINLDHCSKDKAIVKAWKQDKIFHDRISYHTLEELLQAGEYPLEHAAEVRVPNLLLIPGSDKILSPEAMRLFAKSAPQRYISVKEYPEGYHTMHQDIGKEKLWADVLNYINA